MPHVFISYSKKNRDYARKLTAYLQQQGFVVWMDDGINYGADWETEILKAIDGCYAFIVIMTTESEQSKWVQRERLYAEDQQKPPFPLLLEGRVFPFYAAIQYYDVRGDKLPEQAFLEELARSSRRPLQGQQFAPAPPLRRSASVNPLKKLRETPRDRSSQMILGGIILFAALTVIFICAVLLLLAINSQTPPIPAGTPTPTFPFSFVTPTPTLYFG